MRKKRPSRPFMDAAELRRQAEQRLAERRETPASRAAEDRPRLVQDLQVHQFELEIQNEELQRARAELESLLAQYTDLYDFAPVGYFSLGRDGLVLDANLAGARLLEVERSRLVGRRFADFIALDSRPAVTAFLSKVCDSPSTQTCEASLLLATSHHSLHVHIEAVAATDGEGCRAALVDTTERVRAASALEASEVRYRLLFESSKDGVLLLDAGTGVLMAVNPTLCHWLGRPPEFFRGKALWEIGAFEGVVASRQAFLELQQRGDMDRDHLAIAGNGRRVDVELASHTYRVAGGNIMQLTLRDIGERLRSLAVLHEMEEQHRRVQTLEAIGRLAGGIAHELNNKLSVVLGCVELLRRNLSPQGDRERRRLDSIVEAAGHSVALTGQLLAFARKQVLQPNIFAPAALIADMLPRVSPSLGATVQVVLKLNAVGRVRVDRVQLEGVLMILIANAHDAMREGGTLTLEAEDVELVDELAQRLEVIPPGRYVALVVSDTGPGLSAALMDRMFEPFSSTKPIGEGMGMSLAAVYGTVKQSGGYLLVESESGRGATVRIYLRRDESPDAATSRPRVAPAGGMRTVMVVEDEAAIREFLVEAFREEGYEVQSAQDGEEAVEMALASKDPVDLLLTDVVMPRLSGPRAAERIRARWPEMRVLYMSGHPREELSVEGLLGSDGLIQKPFVPSELLRRVRSLDPPVSSRR